MNRLISTWPDAKHIVLSPHLDDAILSCGGRIIQAVQTGEAVAVITVFAGSPNPDIPLSPFAHSLHDRWAGSLGQASADFDYPALRRAEDSASFSTIFPHPGTLRDAPLSRRDPGRGIQIIHLDLPDCIYRTSESGEYLYASEESLFGQIDPRDPALESLSQCPAFPEESLLYAPLSVGDHVDHQIVRQAVEGWDIPSAQVIYYEDYPYARSADSVRKHTEGSGWEPHTVMLDEETLERKVRAIAEHRSQISTFWESVDKMRRDVLSFATAKGGEIYWRRRPV